VTMISLTAEELSSEEEIDDEVNEEEGIFLH
jgi:hypothetical protein